MKTFKTLTATVILCIMQLGYGQNTEFLKTIKTKYDFLLEEQNKGIGLLVKKENKIETVGLGNFGLKANHVFNIGSATKTFTVILLMQEVEKGTIELSDPIGNYLSPMVNVDMTLPIEMLMKHESGLDEVISRNLETIFYAKNDSLYTSSLLQEIEQPDTSMVGKFDYCNTNYLLLGRILENITDQSYFDLLRERIFIPLQMEHTYPYVYKTIPNLATPYHKNEIVTSYLDFRFYAHIAYSAGSIASTLHDMEKFYTSFFETERLLKEESRNKILESGSAFYGLGLEKYNENGITMYGHGGNNIGYAFRNTYNPITKNLYLMFTTSHRMPLESAIASDVMAYLDNKEIEISSTDIDLELFEDFLGQYTLKEANIILEIKKEGHKLYLVGPDTKEILVQKDETTLYELGHGVALEKVEGNKNTLKFTQNGYETKITRVEAK